MDWRHRCLLAIGVLAAAASVGQGMLNATRYSQDFGGRWVTARLLLRGENPYAAKLQGEQPDFERELVDNPRLYFDPDYFPSALLPILPLAMLRFEVAALVWLAINLLATAAIIHFAIRAARTSHLPTAIVPVTAATCAFLAGLPVRNTLGLGQLSLVSLGALLAALEYHGRGRWAAAGMLLAVSWLKYTLIWPYVLFALFYYRAWRALLVAAAIHAVVHTILCVRIGADPVRVCADVLACNADVFHRDSLFNVWSVGRQLQAFWPAVPANMAGGVLVAGLVAMITGLWRRSPGKPGLLWLGLLGVTAMIVVPNKSYCNVYLFFPLLWLALQREAVLLRCGLALTLCYFLYGTRLLAASQLWTFGGSRVWLDGFFYSLLGAMLVAAIRATTIRAVVEVPGRRALDPPANQRWEPSENSPAETPQTCDCDLREQTARFSQGWVSPFRPSGS